MEAPEAKRAKKAPKKGTVKQKGSRRGKEWEDAEVGEGMGGESEEEKEMEAVEREAEEMVLACAEEAGMDAVDVAEVWERGRVVMGGAPAGMVAGMEKCRKMSAVRREFAEAKKMLLEQVLGELDREEKAVLDGTDPELVKEFERIDRMCALKKEVAGELCEFNKEVVDAVCECEKAYAEEDAAGEEQAARDYMEKYFADRRAYIEHERKNVFSDGSGMPPFTPKTSVKTKTKIKVPLTTKEDLREYMFQQLHSCKRKAPCQNFAATLKDNEINEDWAAIR